MATPYNGRYCSVCVGGSSAVVELQGSWNIKVNQTALDLTEFGTVWGKTMWGVQTWSGSFSGFYFMSTAAGSTAQYTMQLAALQGTKVQDIRFYVESTDAASSASTQPKFWMPNYSSGGTNYSTDAGAYIGNMNITAGANALATVSYDVVGFGPIALYKSSSGPTPVY